MHMPRSRGPSPKNERGAVAIESSAQKVALVRAYVHGARARGGMAEDGKHFLDSELAVLAFTVVVVLTLMTYLASIAARPAQTHP